MNAVRWIVMIPLSLVALVLGSFIGGIIGSIFGQSSADVGSGFLGSFAFVFAACAVAPINRARVGQVAALLVVALALGTVLLSNMTDIPEFRDLSDVSKTTVPVFQIVGALYAMFIALPIVLKAGTLEIFGRELAASSIIVLIFGILVATLGAVLGILGLGWLALQSGLFVIGLGAITWVLAPLTPLVFSGRSEG